MLLLTPPSFLRGPFTSRPDGPWRASVRQLRGQGENVSSASDSRSRSQKQKQKQKPLRRGCSGLGPTLLSAPGEPSGLGGGDRGKGEAT